MRGARVPGGRVTWMFLGLDTVLGRLCGVPRARSDPVGESEPKPWGRSVLFLYIFRVIKFLF